MKHSRGIDLLAPMEPSRYHEPSPGILETLSMLRAWEVLGAQCGKCGHTAWLDRDKVIRRFGDQYLQNMGSKLVCRCGSGRDNKVLVGTLARD